MTRYAQRYGDADDYMPRRASTRGMPPRICYLCAAIVARQRAMPMMPHDDAAAAAALR